MEKQEIFKTHIRKYFSPSEYKQKSERERERTIIYKDLTKFSQSEILKRIDQLTEEEQKGFVYVGEKQWLSDYINKNRPFNIYSEWIFDVFQNDILTTKLEWGTEEYDGHVSKQYQNNWTGSIELFSEDFIPYFNEFKTAEFLKTELLDFLEVIIRGDKESPDKDLLIYAFELLHDFPYYIEQLQHPLLDISYDWCIEGIELTDLNDKLNWCIIINSGYASLHYSFENRKKKQYLPPESKKELLIRNLNYNNCPHLDKLLEQCDELHQVRDGFYKILFSYLDFFQGVDRNKILSYWNETYRIPEYNGVRKKLFNVDSYSTFKNGKMHCKECKKLLESDFSFYWGSIVNYPEYNEGDEILWEQDYFIKNNDPEIQNSLKQIEVNSGQNFYETVYVNARTFDKCTECGTYNETLIKIENNKIIGLANKKVSSLEYGESVGSPFISEDLIFFEDYEREYFKSVFIEKVLHSEHNNYDIALQTLSTRYSSAINWLGIHMKRLFHKYSDRWSQEEFLRIAKFLEINFYISEKDNENFQITKSVPVKSCAILKDVSIKCSDCGKTFKSDYWFAWGSLLNFPEYTIGDLITWSDYSLGEKKLTEVNATGYPLLANSEHEKCEWHGEIFIQIINNKIAGVKWQKRFVNIDHVKAYIGKEMKPYLFWPDDEFVKS